MPDNVTRKFYMLRAIRLLKIQQPSTLDCNNLSFATSLGLRQANKRIALHLQLCNPGGLCVLDGAAIPELFSGIWRSFCNVATAFFAEDKKITILGDVFTRVTPAKRTWFQFFAHFKLLLLLHTTMLTEIRKF